MSKLKNATLLTGDAKQQLQNLEDESVQMCITSPPYYGLRDYEHNGQIGLEESPTRYIERLVDVFEQVKRVLKDDGTLWLNIGDSYAGSGKGGQSKQKKSKGWNPNYANKGKTYGFKPKDLMGIPWRVAFVLQDAGWWLRQDIIWHKPNAMPENVSDRPTTSHEHIFLLSKSRHYYYNHNAIKEPLSDATLKDGRTARGTRGSKNKFRAVDGNCGFSLDGRNKRSVWSVNTSSYNGAHCAVYPVELIEPCVLAGSKENDTVLDPFSGSGTTGIAALKHDRKYVGIDLDPKNNKEARKRILNHKEVPMNHELW